VGCSIILSGEIIEVESTEEEMKKIVEIIFTNKIPDISDDDFVAEHRSLILEHQKHISCGIPD
jgi:hypothetical protein